jgi:hypothetical protein
VPVAVAYTVNVGTSDTTLQDEKDARREELLIIFLAIGILILLICLISFCIAYYLHMKKQNQR